MKTVTRVFFAKSFWFLFFLGLNFATGQMPLDLPFLAFFSLVILGISWTRYCPDPSDAFIWGLGFGLGYYGVTFFWIIEPFLVAPKETGWLAFPALISLVSFLSFILSICFYLAASLGKDQSDTRKAMLLAIFFLFSELFRSELVFYFPWGLVSSIWINTPVSQSLAIFGPYWLSGFTLISAFLLFKPWIGSILSLVIIGAFLSYGFNRLSEPIVERDNPIKIRLVQPNINQADKWKPDLAYGFLTRHIEISSAPEGNEIDLIVWPETAVSFEVQNEAKLRKFVTSQLGSALVLGARRFDTERKKLYNSAFMLSKNGDILDFYDKVRLVPFGEYIPFSNFFSELGIFGLATDQLMGFSSGQSKGLFKTNKLGIFKILICYESIFSADITTQNKRPNWIIHITNDAWFGLSGGPRQHLTLARMRAIEHGLPIVRSANSGISAFIDPYGRIQSQLSLVSTGYVDGLLPSALKPTFYSFLGPRFCNRLLISMLMLTILTLIIIKRVYIPRKII